VPDRKPAQPSPEGPEDPDPRVVEETEAAATAAAAIGGEAGADEVDPAERPLRESGQGESEGFEEAEGPDTETAV
jgi:hypothetical protein